MSGKTPTHPRNEPVVCESVSRGVAHLRVSEDVQPNEILDPLYEVFHRNLERGIEHFVLDVSNVPFPSGSFIALLIAMTMEARRRKGDLRIVHLSETAWNHFSIFTPLTYLSIGLDSIVALEDAASVSPSLVKEFAEYEEGRPTMLRVDAVVESLNTATHFVEVLGKKAGIASVELSKLKIAVYEACMNVIEHAYEYEPGHGMELEVLRTGNRFQVSLRDWGKSFDYRGSRPYDVKDAYSEQRNGGFGLYIIQKSVDEVSYVSEEDAGNTLTLVKFLKDG